jgi:Arginyl-tRNA synthetase
MRDSFGKSKVGDGKKVQIEFVSANPTEPLHVGHGRGAAFGDAIGRILEATGSLVEKEYYINDAGRQIDILTTSVLLRMIKEDINNYFPQNAYKGKYIEDIANKLKKDINLNCDYESLTKDMAKDPEKEIDQIIENIKDQDESSWNQAKEFSLAEMVKSIKNDLKIFNVDFDHWFNESSLGDGRDSSSEISNSINKLKRDGKA